MNARNQGQSRTAIILIIVGVVFLFGQVFGLNLVEVVASAFGSVMGAIGGLIGSVFGALGGLIGTVFGTLGGIFGSVFGSVGRVADIGWPFFIILPGLAVLAVAAFGPLSAAAFAIPGAVITGTGLILLFQDVTGRFETWAYLWGLYPAFVGAALMWMGSRQGNRHMAENGRRVLTIGLLLTAGFGLFFELIFGGGFGLVWRYGVPAALIIGGYLLLRRRNAAPALEKAKNTPDYAPLPDKPKNGSTYGISADLERQINEALLEDLDDEPRTTV